MEAAVLYQMTLLKRFSRYLRVEVNFQKNESVHLLS